MKALDRPGVENKWERCDDEGSFDCTGQTTRSTTITWWDRACAVLVFCSPVVRHCGTKTLFISLFYSDGPFSRLSSCYRFDVEGSVGFNLQQGGCDRPVGFGRLAIGIPALGGDAVPGRNGLVTEPRGCLTLRVVT